jgi:hypothetical protein
VGNLPGDYLLVVDARMPEDQRRQVCAPLWRRLHTELPFQAVDPLEKFFSAERLWAPDRNMVLAAMQSTFPEMMRSVLEFGLKNHDRLTSLFGHPPFDGYLGFLINALKHLGTRQTVPLLEAFLELPDVGESAAEAIRAIRSR